ncbi:MAG: hypothetical protein AB1941_11405 [Gemmatimonadota bacterium]
MYCSTCGAHVPAGRTHCTTCGAAVAAAAGHAHPGYGAQPAYTPQQLAYAPTVRPAGQAPPALVGHTCPRCGYVGEGVSYFSKGTHIAGLVALGMISWLVFSLVYFLSFHNHTICPRCGKDWGNQKDYLRLAGAGAGQGGMPAIAAGRGSVANGFSIALFALAAILMIVAVGEFAIGPALFGLAAAGGGAALQGVARREREARRAALLSNLQMPVLALAAQRRGRLTVTETAAALGWPLPRAEKVLNSLEDGLRVNSEVTDEGVIVYEFRELAHGRGPQLPPPAA